MRAGPCKGREGSLASERKGGVGGREFTHAYGLGEGLPLKGSLSPGNQCRGGMEELVRKRALLDELGLWSWTLSKVLTAPPEVPVAFY